MSKRTATGQDVFVEAVLRLEQLYAEGHEVVVSFSGGKDSTVTLQLAKLAAERTGRLPVKCIMRDEEIMFPPTWDYCERVANDPQVDFHWIYACQPILNIFNREMPYWWVFDPELSPDKWVRKPPAIAYRIPENDIGGMTIPSRFPPDDGKTLFAAIGLRAQESRGRRYSVHSAGGHLTKPNKHGVRNVRPIYDWSDGDVWKAISEFGWDYNKAYDTMYRMGVKRSLLRIAPPTMQSVTLQYLAKAAAAWPRWFDQVSVRCPGIRTAAQFGQRAVEANRRGGETWEECYKRTCIEEAPAWIAERSKIVMDKMLSAHRRHSSAPFPEVSPCYVCRGNLGAWKSLTKSMYSGDPFCMKVGNLLNYVEPTFFRPSAEGWHGQPSFG